MANPRFLAGIALLSVLFSSCQSTSRSLDFGAEPAATASSVHRGTVGSGLILARSLFDTKGEVQPATMLIARPTEPGMPWSVETIAERAQKISPQLGVAPDGSRVLRDVDGDGAVYKLSHSPDGWTKGAIDLDAREVVWDERDGGKPVTKDYELGGGNVFHKAVWFEPAFGEPGILTISANAAFLKIWRGGEGAWEPEVLWTESIGEKEHRLRDFEVGDLDGDGQDEIVIVTHDLGRVFVLEQTPTGLEALELDYVDDRIDGLIFNHDVELGQFDDDPALEFCTTPSEPNRLDGNPQRGQIDLWDFDGRGGYSRRILLDSTEIHTKEILLSDLDGDGLDELYAVVEGDGSPFHDGGSNGHVARLMFDGDSIGEPELIHEIPGPFCRFLYAGDTDGDGSQELIASTRRDGIRSIYPDGDTWESRPIAPGFTSGGFEHAIVVFDWDGDGLDDVFAASDPPEHARRLYRFFWVPDKNLYTNEEFHRWPSSESYMTWMLQPLPPGK